MDWGIVVALVSAVAGGGLGAWLGYRYNVRRVDAQNRLDLAQAKEHEASAKEQDASAGKVIGEAWSYLYARVIENQTRLEGRVMALEEIVKARDITIAERDATIDDLKDWADLLVGQLCKAEIEPEPFKRRRQ
jgi:hypothetical protein